MKKRIQAMLDGEDPFGVAHPRAKELFPDEAGFFWSCVDELAPFGSDEGDTALQEYLRWRLAHPRAPLGDCLRWVIESVGEMDPDAYQEGLSDPAEVKRCIEDPHFDEQHFLWTLDISVFATGFAELVVLGSIPADDKPTVAIALKRQVAYAQVQPGWPHGAQYIRNLAALLDGLEQS